MFYIILLAVYYTNDHQHLRQDSQSQLHQVHPGEYMYLFSFIFYSFPVYEFRGILEQDSRSVAIVYKLIKSKIGILYSKFCFNHFWITSLWVNIHMNMEFLIRLGLELGLDHSLHLSEISLYYGLLGYILLYILLHWGWDDLMDIPNN